MTQAKQTKLDVRAHKRAMRERATRKSSWRLKESSFFEPGADQFSNLALGVCRRRVLDLEDLNQSSSSSCSLNLAELRLEGSLVEFVAGDRFC